MQREKVVKRREAKPVTENEERRGNKYRMSKNYKDELVGADARLPKNWL